AGSADRGGRARDDRAPARRRLPDLPGHRRSPAGPRTARSPRRDRPGPDLPPGPAPADLPGRVLHAPAHPPRESRRDRLPGDRPGHPHRARRPPPCGARAFFPALGGPVALALGAIVAPPDEIAATAIAARLAVPRRIVTVLEGGGLLNGAPALTI